MTKERRRSPRTRSTLPVDLYDPKGRMVIGEGRFENLSLQGGLMQTRKPLALYSRIRLLINPTGRTPLDVTGKIVWREKAKAGFAYGVRFQPTKKTAARPARVTL